MKIENSFEEYKFVFPTKSDLKAEIVSFLNSRTGGAIYLGANNDGSAIEFQSPEEKFQEWEKRLAIG